MNEPLGASKRLYEIQESIYPDWLGKSKGERASLAEESVSSLSDNYRADFFDLIEF